MLRSRTDHGVPDPVHGLCPDRAPRARRGRVILSALTLGLLLSAAGDVGWLEQRHAPPVKHAVSSLPPEVGLKLSDMGRTFPGTVGISVRELGTSRVLGWNGRHYLPQQSVSKLWVALTVFDQIDRGKLTLDRMVTITPADLTLFSQPIRALVGPKGYQTTVRDLLSRAMRQSDNTANDSLLRTVGGPEVVRAMFRAKNIEGIRFGPGERRLQSLTAGLTWQQSYSLGNGFQQARAQLPMARRQAAMTAYLADPVDGAQPDGMTHTLLRLWQGELLSRSSTDALLTLMATSQTGRARLKAGLPPGWGLAHKTGTGQELAGLATGFNDVGLVVAADGRVFAVAAMIGNSRAPIAARQRLIADVVRTIAGSQGANTDPSVEPETLSDAR